ncbi:MAG: hypothetical protein RTU30_04010 [Candidatus Thorarchaeota archaeon]
MMSSSWILKTRQMSEAGKEILLREALATHMRSARDRQMFATILQDPRPLEDLLSFFASYYLYHYSGIRLLTFDEAQELTIEEKDAMALEERRQLELELRELLSVKQREEIDIARLVSEFIIQFCDELGSGDPYDESVLSRTQELIIEYLSKVPGDYTPSLDLDFVCNITGWGSEWRNELYTKASGLKESAMTLRDELLREHEFEVVETSILKRASEKIFNVLKYADDHLVNSGLTSESWIEIATTTARRLLLNPSDIPAIKSAHELRISILDILDMEFETPTTIDDFEETLCHAVSKGIAEKIQEEPNQAYRIISEITGIDASEIKTMLARNGISEPLQLAQSLISLLDESSQPATAEDEPQLTAEELDRIERGLKTLEKLEHTLEKPIKGVLKARGLRAAELDKISLDILTKDPSTLIGMEVTVLEELKKKLRVIPEPAEIKRLIEVREQVQSGALGTLDVSSGADMSRQRRTAENIASLKYDFGWHFLIGLFTNLTRVVELYIRSKQDLLRIKALLKSIYEGTEPELQNLREEILIDLASMRIYEMKCALPELDASAICTWMHARYSSMDMSAAREELGSTTSPVFEGISDVSLKLDGLEFDNYAIAFDLMHRFLTNERKKKIVKEEYALEVKREERRVVDAKRKQIDVIAWIDTKAKTVFRSIGRVSTKGIEWSGNDDIKCANLLAFFVKVSRGRTICSSCGSEVQDNKCSRHGKGSITKANDIDNLSAFLMDAITAIKVGLIGSKAEPMTWDEARSIVQREISTLKRRGKITSKTNLKELLPGEINHIIGPSIAAVVGKYFNDSLKYAARRSGFA